MIIRTSSGVERIRIEVIIELMKLDLPDPVAPATSRCGIFARLATTKPPSTSLPSPTTIGWWSERAVLDRSTSPRETTSLSVLGISMPIADLPGIGLRIRTSADATAYAMFLDSAVTFSTLTAGRQRGVRRRLQVPVVELVETLVDDRSRDLGRGFRREDVEAVVGGLQPLLALAQLTVGEHRAVVRRVAHVRVDVHVVGLAAPAAGRRRLGLVRVLVRVGLMPEQSVAHLREPDRHLVERRRGDDQDTEEREQQEQRHHDVRRAQQVEQQARDDVPDRAAGGPQVAGVAEVGLRVALGDLDDAEDAEGQGGPADDLTTGGTGALGVAHRAPAHEEQRERDHEADLADRALDDRAGRVHDRPGQLPPHGGSDDDGGAEEEETEAVATVLGLEVPGGVPHAAGDGAQPVRDRQPD